MGGEVILETALGLFFALSGYHKVMNDGRHESLRETLTEDLPKVGLPVAIVPFMVWWLPCWEFTSGLVATLSPFWHLFGFPIVAKLAMVPMIGIMAVALCCEGRSLVAEYSPIDLGDVLDDWLYLPETLLLVMAVAALLM